MRASDFMSRNRSTCRKEERKKRREVGEDSKQATRRDRQRDGGFLTVSREEESATLYNVSQCVHILLDWSVF